jgi:DNA ligase-1
MNASGASRRPRRKTPSAQVFELGCEGIRRSPRHKSGSGVRFPRTLRWRVDKPVEEADTLDALLKWIDK